MTIKAQFGPNAPVFPNKYIADMSNTITFGNVKIPITNTVTYSWENDQYQRSVVENPAHFFAWRNIDNFASQVTLHMEYETCNCYCPINAGDDPCDMDPFSLCDYYYTNDANWLGTNIVNNQVCDHWQWNEQILYEGANVTLVNNFWTVQNQAVPVKKHMVYYFQEQKLEDVVTVYNTWIPYQVNQTLFAGWNELNYCPGLCSTCSGPTKEDSMRYSKNARRHEVFLKHTSLAN